MQRVDLNGRSPYRKNWFVLTTQGNIVARAPEMDARLVGKSLSQRDYFQGALSLAKKHGGSPVHVSKVYQSILPETRFYKFGFSAVVRHNDVIVGALVATVTTGPSLGLLDLQEGDTTTALLAQRDQSYLPEEESAPADASQYLVLLHPSYRSGENPVWFPKSQLEGLKAGVTEDYRDPVEVRRQPSGGPWLAAFAPVPGTSFVVVVRRPSPTRLKTTSITLGLVLLLLVFASVGYRYWRRAPTTAPQTSQRELTTTRTLVE